MLEQIKIDVLEKRGHLRDALVELLPLDLEWRRYRSEDKLYENNDVRTQYIEGLIKAINNYAVSLCGLLQRSESGPSTDFLIRLQGIPEDVQVKLLAEYRTHCLWGYLINLWTVTEETLRLTAPRIGVEHANKIWRIINAVLTETDATDQEGLFTVIRALRNLQHTNSVHNDRNVNGSIHWHDSSGKSHCFIFEVGKCFDHTQISNEFLCRTLPTELSRAFVKIFGSSKVEMIKCIPRIICK